MGWVYAMKLKYTSKHVLLGGGKAAVADKILNLRVDIPVRMMSRSGLVSSETEPGPAFGKMYVWASTECLDEG